MSVDYTFVDNITKYYVELMASQTENDLPMNSKMAYYEADGEVGGVPILGIRANKNIVYADISSAFPTLCRLLLHNYPKFISQMDSIKDKRKKLIFISTNVNNIRHDFLQLLNTLSKYIIFSHIYNNYMDVNVLEFKKDSLLCTGVRLNRCVSAELDILLNGNFKFHSEDIVDYLRFDKTSIYWYGNGDVQVKGKYKNTPPFLVNFFIKHLHTLTKEQLYNLKTIYSRKYFIFHSYFDDISPYYLFKDKYLEDTNLVPYLPKDAPLHILYDFIYPVLEVFHNK